MAVDSMLAIDYRPDPSGDDHVRISVRGRGFMGHSDQVTSAKAIGDFADALARKPFGAEAKLWIGEESDNGPAIRINVKPMDSPDKFRVWTQMADVREHGCRISTWFSVTAGDLRAFSIALKTAVADGGFAELKGIGDLN